MKVTFIAHRHIDNEDKIISDNELVKVSKRVDTFWKTTYIPLGEITIKELKEIVATFNGDAQWEISNAALPSYAIKHFSNLSYREAKELLNFKKKRLNLINGQIDTLEKIINEYENNN